MKHTYIKTITFYYLILVFAMLSAVLRISESGMSSLYRLTAPLAVLLILTKSPKSFTKDLLLFSIAMGYSLLVSLFFYNNIEIDFIGYAGYLLFLWIIVKNIKRKTKEFDSCFFSFLNTCTIVTVVLGWLQFIFDYSLPYTSRMTPGSVCVFFYNENDFCAAVSCMFVIYAYLIIARNQKKYFPLAASILFFSFINDAKICLIGEIVSVFILVFFKSRLKSNNVLGGKSFFRISIIVFLVMVVSLYFFDINITFRDYTISVRTLLFNPIDNIRMGYMIKGGSIQDRTNAIICGFKELIATAGFGIGFGNSVVMMQKPSYSIYFYNAESMHNILVQLLVEFGYLCAYVYYRIGKTIGKQFSLIGRENCYLMKCAFSMGFIFISAQSSVGVLSNYYLWMVVLFVIFSTELFSIGKPIPKACPVNKQIEKGNVNDC